MGDHPANYSGCPKYQEHLTRVEGKKRSRLSNNRMETAAQYTPWVDNRGFPELRKKPAETTQESRKNANTTHERIERIIRHDSQKATRPETTSNAWLGGSPFSKNVDTRLEQHIHSFQELTREFEILNSLVDVGKLIKTMRQLNEQLLQNKNPLAAIQIFSEFAKNANK